MNGFPTKHNIYSFTEFQPIIDNKIGENRAIDIVGVLGGYTELIDTSNDGQSTRRVGFQLFNERKQRMRCTLWADHADFFMESLPKSDENIHIIVVLQLVRYRPWQGKAGVSNCYFGTRVIFGSDDTSVLDFQARVLENQQIPTTPEKYPIHKQWFDKAICDLSAVHTVEAHGLTYKLEVMRKNGIPTGFHGVQWHRMYKDLKIQTRDILVLSHECNSLFKISVFKINHVYMSADPAIVAKMYTHDKIVYPESEDVIIFPATPVVPKEPVPEVDSDIRVFKKVIDATSLEKHRLTIPAKYVREHELVRFKSAVVEVGRTKVQMKLNAYKRYRPGKPDDYMVLCGSKWKQFRRALQFHQRNTLFFTIDADMLHNKKKVKFSVMKI